ncbi:hypothetical protein M0805_004840 [Coniferiporia weirii]|nr:hypothetical protein M0805_004840 [Coniferiporia weirii]
MAIGLLLVSSSVSLSIPFTNGNFIDFSFTANPSGLSLVHAFTLLLAAFTRIVAVLRQRTYASSLQQEVEFVKKGEGDVISWLSVDSSIVGDFVLTLEIVPPVSLGAAPYDCYIKRLSNRAHEAVGETTKVSPESLSAFRTSTPRRRRMGNLLYG